MRELILGGARSGKSRHAQTRALALSMAKRAPVLCLVTAQALDAEMAERIARHQADRPPAWRVVEAPIALPGWVLDRSKEGFNAPVSHWVLGPLRELCQETLFSEHMRMWFDADGVTLKTARSTNNGHTWGAASTVATLGAQGTGVLPQLCAPMADVVLFTDSTVGTDEDGNPLTALYVCVRVFVGERERERTKT